MGKKISIAHLTKNMSVNGISTVIMNYCRHLDRERFKLTIIAGSPVVDMYRAQCEKLGVEIVELPAKIESSKQYYAAMWKSLSEEKYDVVHVHGNSATITVELMMAKLRGIKARIAHSHNSTCDNMRAHKLLSPIFKRVYTQAFACSGLAGRWLFGEKDFVVLPNGFDTHKFIFDAEKRAEMRKTLGIEDKFVIGNVARFNDQKNHPYLLKVFEAVAKEREDACLLLVGNGPHLEKVKALIDAHPYKDRIIYYGITDHVEYIYDAIDLFLLPSKHEGLGIVFLEAQISGLPCVTSDVVPHEVTLGDAITFLPLEEDVTRWKDAVLNAKCTDRTHFYEQHENEIEAYNIQKNAVMLGEYYEKMVN